ncbi:T9SS type A sorting domain-containing protein [Rufibacter tibetensis]|uniref:Secretion system C-terminal sorting domain-containing protein n=1 Tax=Rufibacter tibetensis TaxID=512763 RepID=A0A0P0C6X9_9BACT|nr:T9SS type A sorting domain-containing protein [Rufibacter tibetensis]ALJ01042.1 hypothetical protein DC20_21165 [Rufibacter tibetensis]
MKKKFLKLIIIILFFVPVKIVFAQDSVYIGKIEELSLTYKNKAKGAANKAKAVENQVSHPLPKNQKINLKLKSSKREGTSDLFFGEVNNIKHSTFYLKIDGREASGSIIMREQKKYYRYTTTSNGSVYLIEEDIDKVLCVGLLEEPKATTTFPSQTINVSTTVPSLQSLPGAQAVLYLDFDGQTVSNTFWNYYFNGGNPIIAAPANLTQTEMVQVWKMMSEDHRPFALNVTTSEAVFNSAPVNRRMRVIFTPTTYFYPGAGGVAYIGSFTWGGTSYGETPCWVFNPTSKYAGEAGSHEAGHTFRLGHDGRTSPAETYFYGQNNWAPIMGVGYSRQVVQWSQGEYPYANNRENDLSIITTMNGFSYRQDDHGNDNVTATGLVECAGNIMPLSNKGVITTRNDVDAFSFTTIGGRVSLTVNPDPDYPNLDIFLTLRDVANTIVATADPSTLSASLDLTLEPGTYYLTVDGTKGALGADSDYASLGEYTVSGTMPTTITAMANGTLTCSVLSVELTGSSSIKGVGTSYAWTGPEGAIITDGNTLTPSVNLPGEYTLSVTSADGCTLTAKATVVQDISKPVVTATATGVLNCQVLKVELTGSSSVSGEGVFYTWVGPPGASITNGNTLTPSVDMAGDYTLSVTGVNGCTSTATVNVVKEPCSNLNCTLSQGFYGNSGGKYCDGRTSVQLISDLLSKYGQGGMVIGKIGSNSLTIKASDAACIISKLPAGGPAKALVGNSSFNANTCLTQMSIPVNKQGRFTNTLLGQTITLGLNLKMDNTSLGSMVIRDMYMVTVKATECGKAESSPVIGTEEVFTFPLSAVGKTVNQLYAMANEALGGGATAMSLGDLTKALGNINDGFDECRFLDSFSATPPMFLLSGESYNSSASTTMKVEQAQSQIHAYPNPFNERATIIFSLAEAGDYSLTLHDVKGNIVKSISTGYAKKGTQYSFSIENDLPAGIYMARLSGSNVNKLIRISLQK